jgi:hypothetical protein
MTYDEHDTTTPQGADDLHHYIDTTFAELVGMDPYCVMWDASPLETGDPLGFFAPGASDPLD